MNITEDLNEKTGNAGLKTTGPWSSVLNQLYEWDPMNTEILENVSMNPWKNNILSIKEIELICIALYIACTNLQPEGSRLHIRAALEAGATREEILQVFKMGFAMGIHSCSIGAPILLEEAKNLDIKPNEKKIPTPYCEQMKAMGQWNDAWNPFLELDPLFTDQFMAAGNSIYKSGIMSARLVELMSIAFDASITHLYTPGIRRHIVNSLKAGATMAEIMEVLKLCVIHGIQVFNLGIPILAEELDRFSKKKSPMQN